MPELKTIKVTGKGKLKVRPDMTRISITIGGVKKDYAAALKKSSDDTRALRDLLAGLDFAAEDLKTTSFSVDTEYESYKENGSYKQRLAGYRYRHSMKLEFDSDNELLGKVLYALGGSDIRPEFSISYTVRDPEAAKNELLGKAVADARAKAVVLTAAAGVALGELININYSWGQVNFEVHPMRDMMLAKGAIDACAVESYDLDIEPDDITVEDIVTILWEIR